MATTQVLNPLPSNVAIVNSDGTPTREFLRAWLNRDGVISGSTSTSAGVDPAVGGVNIANFTMDSGTPASRHWEYPNTNPNGWNLRASQMTLNADFISTNYFTLNPGAHVIVGLRGDLDALALGDPRFHGIILNSVVGAQEGAPNYPTTQIESRATGLDPGGTLRYLFPNTSGSPTKPLADGVQYRLCLRSTLTENNQRFVRYQLWRLNTAHSSSGEGAWDIERDTGDVLDANTWLDMTKYGLAWVSVFEVVTAVGAWSIFWSNVNLTWAGIKDSVTDSSPLLQKYDAQVEGDLTFVGNARKCYVYMDSTLTNFTDWTQVISSTTNSNTSLCVVPNGASTAANVITANKSTMTGSFAIATYGMNGANAEMTTLGIGGAAAPPIKIMPGGSAVPGVWSTTGLTLNGAGSEMGVAGTKSTGLTNAGGTQATGLVAGGLDLEYYSTTGNIAAAVGGGATVSAAQLETFARALTAALSCYIADGRARKAW